MNRNSGMSLVEILVACGILIGAMLPLWGLMGTSHKQASMSMDELRASQVAVEIIEQIENIGWTGNVNNVMLVNDGVTKIDNNLDITLGEFPEYQKFTINITTTTIEGSEDLGKIVQLTVNYYSKELTNSGDAKEYTLGTFISGS
ncbi:MAG: hypothetical protein BWY02_00404 [bacterium ADurb.Bin157]|jgi:type II secretory pathway pseudopilin PulG|nr:hypothetical protein [bacterium]OQB50577.1 MAG: hypothetical protein BWY02_00404 [bacterium ADurb.Bin157]